MIAFPPPSGVLAAFGGALAHLRWVPVSGGFSGATVCRGDDVVGTARVALKQWPAETTPERLAFIHAAVARLQHISFVPQTLPTASGEAFVAFDDALWDATRWLPGAACAAPSVTQAEAAGAAVARLHSAWPVTRLALAPGVRNRLRVLREWMQSPTARPDRGFPPPLLTLLQRSWELATRYASEAARALLEWENVPVPLRLCVRDLRAEHVLFTGDDVTGIVDYGAVAEDHAAVDLARLLGDYPADETLLAAGLRGYAGSGETLVADLVRLLARTGLLCSVIGWLVRLLVERRAFPDLAAVSARLARLVSHIELLSPL